MITLHISDVLAMFCGSVIACYVSYAVGYRNGGQYAMKQVQRKFQ